jgi:branched-chain amino acid transport system substrate-binding protein
MNKAGVLAVVLALVAIVVSASSLYYSISFMGAVGRIDEIQGNVKDVQDDVKDVQGKVDDLWKEVFGKPTPPPTPPPPPLTGQIFKVGLVSPLSGANAPFGLAGKRGVEWATEEINAAGGILGAFIQLLVEDSAGDPKIAVSATEKLITVDRCQVVRVAFGSPETLAAMEVTEKYEIPLVTVGCSADSITMKGYRYIFRVTSNSTSYNFLIGGFLKESVKPKTLAFMYENRVTDIEAVKAFTNYTLTYKPGWEIVASEVFPVGALDLKPLLEKLKLLNPDVLYLAGYLTSTALALKQMKEIGWRPKLILCAGAAGLQTPEIFHVAGEDAKYCLATNPFWCDRVYPNATYIQELGLKCWNKYNYPMDFQVFPGYTGMWLLKMAIEKCKSLDPKAIRDALATTEFYIPWYGKTRFYSNGQMLTYDAIIQVQDARPDEPWQYNGLTFHTIWPPPYNSSKLMLAP